MDAIVLINGFLSYLLLMVITVGVALLCGFAALRIRKKNDAKKKAKEEVKSAK